jgi:flagellar basal body-associated protein FliL
MKPMLKYGALALAPLVLAGLLLLVLFKFFPGLTGAPAAPAATEQAAAEHGAKPAAEGGEQGKKGYEFGAVHAIADLIINPKGSSGRRVFKISVALEYDPANAELAKEMEERTPFMRDFLITYLSGMNEDSLSDISYRETIRDSLGVAMNRFLSAGKVDRVLFQDFIRQ